MHSTKLIAILVIFLLAFKHDLYARYKSPSQTNQRTKPITGTITDSKTGAPLSGVSVQVKGTTQGSVTDANGKFTLNVPDNGAVLVVSSIGYAVQEINVTAKTTSLTIKLNQSSGSNMDEVVIVGYGTQRRGDVTSAVASVKSDKFTQGFARDAAQLIQGKVAGVSVRTVSGDPTAGTQISLRGITTLNASTAPLVLIDGVPGNLNTVAPEDIESIDVLKDGAAAAIYGTRGTNGVILITTVKRKGGNRPPTISYSGYVSYQQIARKMEVLTAADYRRLISQNVKGFNQTLDSTKPGYTTVNGANDEWGASTDWFKEISRNPISYTHNLTLQGGNAQTNYTASLNYRNWEGIFRRSDNNQLTGRFEINHSMFDGKLKFNLNAINRSQKYFSGANYNWIYRQALIRNPTEPVKTPTGEWYERDIYFYQNPVRQIYETEGETRTSEIWLNGNVTFTPIRDLNIKLLVSGTKTNSLSGYSENFNFSSNNGRRGYASRSERLNQENLLEFTTDYSRKIKDHKFTALGGYSYIYNATQGFSAVNSNFPTDLFTYNNLQSGDALTLQNGPVSMNSDKSDYKLISFFGRLNYSWRDKYLLTGSLRYEGSSKFGKNYKWGNFPAASIGWRLNKENFMQSVKFINDLKLRAGYGITGTAPSSSYLSLVSLSYGSRFLYNGNWIQQIAPTRNPNPDLRWEKKQELNIGLDFALLNNRISGSIDAYQRTTKDMLFNYSVPTPPYLYGSILANVGSMRNKGIEVLINVIPVRSKNMEWNSNITYSANQNKLLTLSNTLFQTTVNYIDAGYTGEPIQEFTHRNYIGQALGTFYGYKSVDIAADSTWIIEGADGKAKPMKEAKPTDKKTLGNGIPKYIMGWNNTFRYKQFDLNVNIRGAFGFQILNFQKMYYANPKINQYNMLKQAFNPVYGKTPIYADLALVSYYVEQGDYIKIDNVSLGYTFNLKTNKVIKNFRVYVAGLNLITITKYSGVDPEVNASGLNPGNDERDKYPTIRTFTLGANLSF